MTKKNVKSKLYLVSGVKGGVGKSLISMALLHYLMSNNDKCLLVETDKSNPDVYKSYSDVVSCEMVNLKDKNGWMDLVDILDNAEYMNHTVIVNGAAGNDEGVDSYGEILKGALPILDREIVTFWIINNERDSIELLRDYLDVMTGKVYVILNGFFGSEDTFKTYNNAQLKTEIEERGGQSFYISDLAKRVTTLLYSERKSIERASKDLPLSGRMELERWLGQCKTIFNITCNNG